MKTIEFMGDSLSVIREFTKETRREIGYQLESVQVGLPPQDWKPMKTVGPGVKEIRVRNQCARKDSAQCTVTSSDCGSVHGGGCEFHLPMWVAHLPVVFGSIRFERFDA